VPSAPHLVPVSKMGRQGIEIEIEPVTGEGWEAARGQALSQGVDEQVSHLLCARTQREHGQNLRAGINQRPQPENLVGAAQPGAQFIHLQMREVQMAEETFVQGLCMFPHASEPGGNGGLLVAKDPRGRGWVQPFSQRSEHHGNLVRGRFQPVEGRVAPGSERGTAGLTPKGLDRLGTPMLAIANQRVDSRVSAAKVPALRVRTGEPGGVHSLGCSPPAFHLSPGTRLLQAPALHPTRQWRPDDKQGSHLECEA
jgi:hypothetical protein